MANRVISSESQVSDEVFKHAYIPRTLTDVIDFERDLAKATKGNTEGVRFYSEMC
jgi:hypothetical protein